MRKKVFFMLLACLMGMGHTKASDVLTVSDVILPQNSEATIEICCGFDTKFRGYSLDIELDGGLALVLNSDNKPAGENGFTGTDHSITSSQLSEGKYRFVVVSAQGKLLPMNGSLLKVKVTGADTKTIGDKFTGKITATEFTDIDLGVNHLSEVSFDITIGEPDDGRLKFYETSATLPAYTAGEKANVTMFRSIKANEWSTICLPFTLPKAKAEAIFGTDVEIYKYTGYTATIEDPDVDLTPSAIQINFSKHTLTNALSSIAGGTPYLIKTSKDIESFEADEVKLVDAATSVQGNDTEYGDLLGGCFKGTFVATKIPSDGLFVSENKYWYSKGLTNVKAFRAWFELDAVLNKEIELSRITFNFDDTVTGINSMQNTQYVMDEVYDLQGRKIQKPTKGMYIKNGKIMVTK